MGNQLTVMSLQTVAQGWHHYKCASFWVQIWQWHCRLRSFYSPYLDLFRGIYCKHIEEPIEEADVLLILLGAFNMCAYVTLQFVIITQFVIHYKLRWIATQFVIHRISNCVVRVTQFVMYYKLRQNFIILKYWKGEKNWPTAKCIASIISYYDFS